MRWSSLACALIVGSPFPRGCGGSTLSGGSRRRLPQVYVALRRVTIDLGELVVAESEPLERVDGLLELRHAARADERRDDPRVAQRPRDRHLRKRLSPRTGDGVETADAREVLLAEHLAAE